MLKDLSSEGYTVPREAFNELDDSKAIIQRLAQFHAASFYLADCDGFDFIDYNYSIYQTESVINAFFLDTLKAFKETLETWEGYVGYIPKLEYLMGHIGEIGKKCYLPNKPGEGFNVLNHGDFHLRNILTLNDSAKRLKTFKFVRKRLWVCKCLILINVLFLDRLPIERLLYAGY